MPKLSITVAREISYQRITDLLSSAIEGGGIGYWAQIEGYNPPSEVVYITNVGDEVNTEIVYRHLDYPLNPGGAVLIYDLEGDEVKSLNLETITKGLQVMAEKEPWHFGNFLTEDDDASTGDVFVQCCLFEEVIYG
jgi:hypothetical protein